MDTLMGFQSLGIWNRIIQMESMRSSAYGKHSSVYASNIVVSQESARLNNQFIV